MSKKQKALEAETPTHAAPTPRTIEEINKVYEELCKRAGATQYRMAVDQRDLDQLNEALFNVNNEAAARQALDAKEAKEKDTSNVSA